MMELQSRRYGHRTAYMQYKESGPPANEQRQRGIEADEERKIIHTRIRSRSHEGTQVQQSVTPDGSTTE